MRLRFFSINIIIAFLIINPEASGTDHKAVKGVLDLKEQGNQEKFIVKLNGEWEFYWNKMLQPGDFSANSYN